MATTARRPAGGLPIAWALTFGFGAIVLAAMALLVSALVAGGANTIELLTDKSRLAREIVERRTEQFLDPAGLAAFALAGRIESDDWRPADDARSRDILLTTLKAIPQLRSAVFASSDGTVVAAYRDSDPATGGDTLRFLVRPMAADERDALALKELRALPPAGGWGEPAYVDQLAETVVNFRLPVRVGDALEGLVATTISVADLSRFVTAAATEIGQSPFILFGRERVLAHRELSGGFPANDTTPLRALDEVGDPVLASIWLGKDPDRAALVPDAHWVEWAGEDYLFVYTEIDRYGATPWLVGSYFTEDSVAAPVRRLVVVAALGALTLVLAVLAALRLARRVARPLESLAVAAAHVRDLQFDRVEPLPRSGLRELDGAAETFEGMLRGLRAFARYVPRSLLRRLQAVGGLEGLASERREITVMFTDISAFTALSAEMGPEDTARFLNTHFERLTAAVEVEGGTVDKFMGDGLMAFWGAPEAQPDQRVRALRAARAIAAGVAQDALAAEQPIRLRLGVCTGPAVVGNIGSDSRMNYTLIGTPVNVAQRLVELAREVDPAGDAVVLVDAPTAEATTAGLRLVPLGAQHLRGQTDTTDVYRLALDPA